MPQERPKEIAKRWKKKKKTLNLLPSKHTMLSHGGLLSNQPPPFSCPAMYGRELSLSGDTALWLLEDSASGRYWQEAEGWKEEKDWGPSTLSASRTPPTVSSP